MRNFESIVSLTSDGVWDLQRKGPIDHARHNEKIKDAIRENLPSIIADEAIITSDGQRIVKVPIRGLDLPDFRFDFRQKPHLGQGDGSSQVGDVIGVDSEAKSGQGRGKRAGELPGIDYYEAEVTIDELTELVFEDLSLPHLKRKRLEQITGGGFAFDEIRNKGLISNLDKRRTVFENIKRNVLAGKRAVFGNLADEDLRIKTLKETPTLESNASVLAMRDVSGSMGEFEKYVSRSFYFWMVKFLRSRYDNVKITFLTHHTEAQEVDEQAFFKLGESGGTRVSSVYKLALEIINQRFDPKRWNIYPFHFSDGDNWGTADNDYCLELIRQLLKVSNLVGYGEIQEYNYNGSTTLWSTFQALKDQPNFSQVIIKDKSGVYQALKTFFKSEADES